jgi:hypothetical protein
MFLGILSSNSYPFVFIAETSGLIYKLVNAVVKLIIANDSGIAQSKLELIISVKCILSSGAT